MSFDSLIKSRIAEHLTGEKRFLKKRRSVENQRKRRDQPHIVDYFHDVADPYCHLTAQILEKFAQNYNVVLRPHLISGSPDWAAVDRPALEKHARVDANLLAKKMGFGEFSQQPPAEEQIAQAEGLLAAGLEREEFPQFLNSVSLALWSGDKMPAGEARPPEVAKQSGDQRLAHLGHYLGGTFHYGGEWYWGVDRLHYLESRLRDLGLDFSKEAQFCPPNVGEGKLGGKGLAVEAFISFRSPYSYLALNRLRNIIARSEAELIVRPVLPMVMRGLPVPKMKKNYILQDSAREARRLGIPFGRICDPLGKAVERGYSLLAYAENEGRLLDYCSAFMKAVWSQGIDATKDKGLALIVENSGLEWSQAKSIVDNTDWHGPVEANQLMLAQSELWGVPSFRVGDTSIWGQDRLWVLEDMLIDG